MAKTPTPQEKDKSSKRTKGKGKVTKEPAEAAKTDSASTEKQGGFSLFKSAASKDAELDDLFSKSVRMGPIVRRRKGLMYVLLSGYFRRTSTETSQSGKGDLRTRRV